VPDETAGRLGGPLARRIVELGAAVVVVDGEEASGLLEGLVLDPDRLRSSVALASDLAAPTPTGPYR
jgi:hypothetical protein